MAVNKVCIGQYRLMSIDPSINNLGVAIWDGSAIQLSKKLMFHKLMHPEKEYRENEYEKSFSMKSQLKDLIHKHNVTRIILEIPEHWAVGGFEAREKGSMTKLMFVCGMLYSLLDEVEEYKLVTPRAWKGQLPKEVVAARLREEYLPLGIDMALLNENVMDAIAIGHFYIYGSV